MANTKPRYKSEEELKSAVVAACLEEFTGIIRKEFPATGRGAWTVGDSQYLTDGRHDPERQKEREEYREACKLFLDVREAILKFDSWARNLEETRPKAKNIQYYAIFQNLAPALLPLVRDPYRHGHILGEDIAMSWRNESAPPWEMNHRQRLVYTLDRPLLPGTNVRFDPIGMDRPLSDRELALITLSAGHFPRLDLARDTVADVVAREQKTIRKVRRKIWKEQTDGLNVGPNQPAGSGGDDPNDDPDGNTEAEP